MKNILETEKKGQAGLQNLAGIIILLVIAAFALILGIQLLNGFNDATDNYVGTATNESGAYINGTSYTFTQSTRPGFNSPAVVTAINATSGAVIPAGNYTISGFTLKNLTSFTWPAVNVTYTYLYGQDAFISGNKSIRDIAGFTDYWSLIVLAVVIGIIIGLILLFIGKKKVA